MGIGFKEKLLAAQETNNTLVSIGLDDPCVNRDIVKQAATQACMIKIDPAAYFLDGFKSCLGMRKLSANIDIGRRYAPNLPILLDGKFNGSARANESYAKWAYDCLEVDAVTIGYSNGMDTFVPFLQRDDKFAFVVCKTSNEASGEFQDLLVPVPGQPIRAPYYQYVAWRITTEWEKIGRCGLVVGATHPDSLRRVRETIGDHTIILSPGAGTAQGGSIKKAVHSGKNSDGAGIVMHFSRQFEHSKTPGDELRMLREEVNQYR